jgi:hypothetical protein
MVPGFVTENALATSIQGGPRRGGETDAATAPHFVRRNVRDLRPWPGFEDVRRPLAAQKLFAMAESGEAVFREPILVTQGGIILDGHARWVLAQQQRRETIECIEHTFRTEVDELQFLLLRHTSHAGSLTPFSRIVLARDLMPVFRVRARENQRTRVGGQLQSTLTQGEPFNVRQEIANLAQVSVGNVTKVAQILDSAIPELIDALREGEISIHRANIWSKLASRAQRSAIFEWGSQRDVRKTIRRMVSKHVSNAAAPLTAAQIIRSLAKATDDDLGNIGVSIIKQQGRHLVVTNDLVASLQVETCEPTSMTPGRQG